MCGDAEGEDEACTACLDAPLSLADLEADAADSAADLEPFDPDTYSHAGPCAACGCGPCTDQRFALAALMMVTEAFREVVRETRASDGQDRHILLEFESMFGDALRMAIRSAAPNTQLASLLETVAAAPPVRRGPAS